MSSALAIASVTAVLKNLLNNELISRLADMAMGDVSVTSLPPDRVPTGLEEHAQLNLFLYRVTPNTCWRRTSASNAEETQRANPPLALDLHYLLTAYGERDAEAEIILGHALQLLHATPILTQEIMRSALDAISASSDKGNLPGLAALSISSLADQVEPIKLSPEFLGMEEMARLWSALQTRLRLSLTYQASLVLIDGGTDNARGLHGVARGMIS